MTSRSRWGMSAGESVKRECTARGTEAVVAGSVALLQGEDVDEQLIHPLGGPPANWALSGAGTGPDYWLRVWAARGLLYAYDDTAEPAVIEALGDEMWRVREAAVRVCSA